MYGDVSLLCLCLLFVSSSVQGGQENLPSTWTRIVRENAEARLDEGKEGVEKTFRMYAEQLSICNSRTLVILQSVQTKLDDEKVKMEEKLRMKAEELASVNSRMLALQARFDEKKEGVEQIHQVYAKQMANFNARLDEAQQKLTTASLNHHKTTETLRADNLRLKQQLEETTTNFGVQIERLEGQLAVTTAELKTKSSELTRCDVESTTLRENVKQTFENIDMMNQEIKNQTMDFQQNIYDVILNATNLQTVYVKEVTKQLEQDFLKMNANVTETVFQSKEDLKSTSVIIKQDILNFKSDMSKNSDKILQEFTSTKSKLDAGFSKMTQERDSKYNSLQNKHLEILEVIEAKTIKDEIAAKNSTGSTKNSTGSTKNISTYYFSKEKKLNWQDAQNFCQSIGQNLATIDSIAKNLLIQDRVKELGMCQTGVAWIGATDEAVNGLWQWIGTGQIMSYKNWMSGEPNGGTKENCLTIYNHGTWNDNECSLLLPFICEQ